MFPTGKAGVVTGRVPLLRSGSPCPGKNTINIRRTEPGAIPELRMIDGISFLKRFMVFPQVFLALPVPDVRLSFTMAYSPKKTGI
jgi:hypothetical protein